MSGATWKRWQLSEFHVSFYLWSFKILYTFIMVHFSLITVFLFILMLHGMSTHNILKCFSFIFLSTVFFYPSNDTHPHNPTTCITSELCNLPLWHSVSAKLHQIYIPFHYLPPPSHPDRSYSKLISLPLRQPSATNLLPISWHIYSEAELYLKEAEITFLLI